MLSLKFLLKSTILLLAAVMLKYSVPALAEFAVYEVLSVYNGAVSWLSPPYLYLIINCIILTIVASSKLQSTKDDDILEPMVPEVMQSQSLPVKTTQTAAEYRYNGVVLSDSTTYGVKEEDKFGYVYEKVEGESAPFNASAEDALSNKENEFVIGKSTWNVLDKKDSTEYSSSDVKQPPVSARFDHRRNVKASPEGGKTVLGVSKQKKLDTMETKWKTTTKTKGRHLRKSDTWECDGHQEKKVIMTKAETFNYRTNTNTRSPSLSNDELTRRIEAFIKKFNEDMRLQRQESLNHHKEIITNRNSVH
ncbi:hypothetical protein ACJIZ3_012658 [Penstemon smallii]|uniref:DUF4408 domain-containing protein n=1 Tax=Penstemon smallii TaxID=265156 RepID=A0ABD3UMN3_9LAMI